jgi:CBS domain-containing protein
VRIGGLYSPGLRTCSPTDLLPDAAHQMAFAEIGALAVTDPESGALIGIVTERDLVWALASDEDPRTVEVRACASPDVSTAETGEHAAVVARRMLDAGVRHLPVVEQGRPVGMVSMRDLLAVETWL